MAHFMDVKEGCLPGYWVAFDPLSEGRVGPVCHPVSARQFSVCSSSTCKAVLKRDGPTHMWVSGEVVPYQTARAWNPDDEIDTIYIHECGFSLAFDSTLGEPTETELNRLSKEWAKNTTKVPGSYTHRRSNMWGSRSGPLTWHFGLEKTPEDEIDDVVDEVIEHIYSDYPGTWRL